uniref:Red alga Gracilaria chilensis plasmid GC2 DNA sequence n=1 Tax=Agarophyton chilense TaxID=2510777 RepID=Q39773_AGACH|nr:unnamed protein product [Agarophyton chilense]
MSNHYINSEIKRILDNLVKSSYSKQYFLYKSENIVLSQSSSEDDWNYCLLILKFVNPKDSIKIISSILEFFLRSDRHRDKFDEHFSYLNTTIAKAIVSSSHLEILGCLYSQNSANSIQSVSSYFNRNNITISCKINNVLKISNFLSIFYLHTPSYSDSVLDYEFNYSFNSNVSVKISMLGGLLNHFDLMVFLSILYAHKLDTILYPDNVVDINFSNISFMLSDNGRNRFKYLNSLEKLSKVHLHSFSSSKESLLSTFLGPSGCAYSFSGTLLSFEQISTKSLTNMRVYLSEPILKMLTLKNNYSIVNWLSFSSISSYQIRLLYFYFCLHVKVSRYFQTFLVDRIVNDLYISASGQSSIRSRKFRIRRMLQSIYDSQQNIIDFDFQLIFSSCSSKRFIQSIKVRRSKVVLIN